ncbi:MAG: hypothetical protein HRU18_02935 [Pseudoalteromonas sp.]|uniref:hypothetical protein n=1 Tax=Pseudoalteromonas sp. TaxID=53249 RepID=UPI001DB04077|nr:hypothetical protein [Pseudoalteromonas sp.]NRA77140.1 hypothetical protein [Pseudoalteromonas sp.]
MVTKVFVSQVALPLMEDYENPFAEFVLKSTLTDDNLSDTTSAILDVGMASLEANVQRYYNAGASGVFFDGLPTGNSTSAGSLTETTLVPILAAIEGEPIILIDNIVLPLGALDGALDVLHRNYDYDPFSGVVGVHNFSTTNPVIYEKLESEFTGLGNHNEVIYVLVDGVSTELFRIFTGYNTIAKEVRLSMQSTYRLTSDATNTEITWVYTTGGGHSILDEAMSTSGLDQEVYPIVTIRQSGVNIVDAGDDVLTTSSRNTLNHLGVSLDDLCASLTENENDDDIEDAHVFLSLHVDSEQPAVRRYLFDYFDDMRESHADAQAEYGLFLNGQNNAFKGIQFNISERTFLYQLTINYIERTDNIALVIGDIGTMNLVVTPGTENPGHDNGNITYTRQITATHCSTVMVHGLRCDNTIGVHRTQLVRASLWHLGPLDSDMTITVPLNRITLNKLSRADRNVVVAASLQLNLYAQVIRKLKWYETGLFKAILVIVSVVLAVVSLGSSAIITSGLYAAGGAVMGMLLVLELVLNYLVGLLIIKAAEYVAEKVGGKVALIIAAVVLVAGLAMGTFNINIKLLDAKTLLTASNALVKGVSNNAAEEIKSITLEHTARMEEIEKAYEGLEEYDSLFDEGIDLYTQTYNQEFVNNPNEHPDMFYDRTSDLDFTITGPTYQIDKFYDNSLELPGTDF